MFSKYIKEESIMTDLFSSELSRIHPILVAFPHALLMSVFS